MRTWQDKNRAGAKLSLGLAAILLTVGAIAILFLHYESRVPPADRAFVEKLVSPVHCYRPVYPLKRQPIKFDVGSPASMRYAVLEAIGMETREVSVLATGAPEVVFGVLSNHLGEIVTVDHWSNFPIKLPPAKAPLGSVEVPRRVAVRAALAGIEASGGFLIRAGENRYLVAKRSEKTKYEAAIRELGWLHGSPPPWLKQEGDHHLNTCQGGAATGSQPIRSETNRTSSAVGFRR